jgi:hypothetical protein
VDDHGANEALLFDPFFADPHPQETFVFAEQPPPPPFDYSIHPSSQWQEQEQKNNVMIDVRLDGPTKFGNRQD